MITNKHTPLNLNETERDDLNIQNICKISPINLVFYWIQRMAESIYLNLNGIPF